MTRSCCGRSRSSVRRTPTIKWGVNIHPEPRTQSRVIFTQPRLRGDFVMQKPFAAGAELKMSGFQPVSLPNDNKLYLLLLIVWAQEFEDTGGALVLPDTSRID